MFSWEHYNKLTFNKLLYNNNLTLTIVQVRPGYQEHNARPASIHISSQYSEHAIFNSASGVGNRHGGTMFNDHIMYRSMESMCKLGNTSEHTSDTTLSVPGELSCI